MTVGYVVPFRLATLLNIYILAEFVTEISLPIGNYDVMWNIIKFLH